MVNSYPAVHLFYFSVNSCFDVAININTMADLVSPTRSTFAEQKLILRAPSPARGHNPATASQDPADQRVVYGELSQQLERILGAISTYPREDPTCGRVIQAVRGMKPQSASLFLGEGVSR